jgi:hypothetical protein
MQTQDRHPHFTLSPVRELPGAAFSAPAFGNPVEGLCRVRVARPSMTAYEEPIPARTRRRGLFSRILGMATMATLITVSATSVMACSGPPHHVRAIAPVFVVPSPLAQRIAREDWHTALLLRNTATANRVCRLRYARLLRVDERRRLQVRGLWTEVRCLKLALAKARARDAACLRREP